MIYRYSVTDYIKAILFKVFVLERTNQDVPMRHLVAKACQIEQLFITRDMGADFKIVDTKGDVKPAGIDWLSFPAPRVLHATFILIQPKGEPTPEDLLNAQMVLQYAEKHLPNDDTQYVIAIQR